MLKSLLVPLDGFEMGEWSMPLASKVARSAEARIHLATVIIPRESDELLATTSFQWDGEDLRDFDERREIQAAEYLRRWQKRLAEEGTDVDVAVLEGTPVPDELVEHTSRVEADLIVMTSQGRSGLSRVLLGSVAHELVRMSATPVLVMHPTRGESTAEPPRDLGRILVPLDGSSVAEAVLGPVAELATTLDAEITLTRVVIDPSYLGPRVLGLRPDRLAPDLDAAEAYLETIAADLREEGLDVDVQATSGDDPAKAIARVAGELGVDALALATHGRGGLERAVLGSVTDGILKSTSLPLLIVRPPDAD